MSASKDDSSFTALDALKTHAKLDAWWLPRAVEINRLSVTDVEEWRRVSDAIEATRARLNK
jgi:hypothetical protein